VELWKITSNGYEKCGWTIQAVEGPDGKRAWLIAAPDGYSYLHMTNRGRDEAMDFADMRIREQGENR
jgi:hypothetical protein